MRSPGDVGREEPGAIGPRSADLPHSRGAPGPDQAVSSWTHASEEAIKTSDLLTF